MSKKEKLRIREYLSHIVEAVGRIEQYVSNMEGSQFLSDQKTQDAVIRNFEIIGEACNNVSKHHPEFAALYAEIPREFAYEMPNAQRACARLFQSGFGSRLENHQG
jgi:uncharacterized protein with HEPN domain